MQTAVNWSLRWDQGGIGHRATWCAIGCAARSAAAAIGLLSPMAAAQAQELVDPSFYVGVRAGIQPENDVWSRWSVPQELSRDVSTSGPGTTGSAQARAEAHGGTTRSRGRPQAIATANARATAVQPRPGRDSHTDISAMAEAQVSYAVRVQPRTDAGLVWRPQAVPVLVDLIGEASISGTPHVPGTPGERGGRAHALAWVTIDTASIHPIHARTDTFPGSSSGGSFNRSISLQIPLRDPFVTVNLYAYAGASASATSAAGFLPEDTNAAHALADPVFRFDQAAFDRTALAQGLPTFALDSAFAFSFSPGVFNGALPVPEPGTGSLFLVGLGLAVLARRATWRTRSPRAASVSARAGHARSLAWWMAGLLGAAALPPAAASLQVERTAVEAWTELIEPGQLQSPRQRALWQLGQPPGPMTAVSADRSTTLAAAARQTPDGFFQSVVTHQRGWEDSRGLRLAAAGTQFTVTVTTNETDTPLVLDFLFLGSQLQAGAHHGAGRMEASATLLMSAAISTAPFPVVSPVWGFTDRLLLDTRDAFDPPMVVEHDSQGIGLPVVRASACAGRGDRPVQPA